MNRLPNEVAIEAVRFSKERFQQQNWIGNTTEPWKPRKVETGSRKRASRNVLTDTGRLRRSIRKTHVSPDRIVIGTDVEYAKVHNDGGRYRINQRVRAHERKAHKRAGTLVRAHRVDSFNRTITVNFPKRQFIGESQYLLKRLHRIIIADINKNI